MRENTYSTAFDKETNWLLLMYYMRILESYKNYFWDFYNRDIYRIFTFFDDNKLVILLHGFQKKAQKTPRREIEQAKKLRKEYYDEKESKNNQ